MSSNAHQLRDLVVAALDELKGRDAAVLDVSGLTSMMDYMIVVTGNSGRHVKALTDQVVESAKAEGYPLLGIEGRETHAWALVDLGDIVVHVMQAEPRAFYDLERLWTPLPADSGVQP